MSFFVPGDLDHWPWPPNSSERGTKRVFRVNLAQIRLVVRPTYFISKQNKSSAVADMGGHARAKSAWKQGAAVSLSVVAAGSPSHTMWPGLRPISIPRGILTMQPLGHNRHGPKSGGQALFVPLFGRQLGPHLTQCCLYRHLPPYQVASWSIQPLATTHMGQNLGGRAVPPFLEGELGPHPTQCGLDWGLPPYQVAPNPSNHLATIHQRYSQKDNGLIM